MDCAGNGVPAPVHQVIGTMMAAEALKYLAGVTSVAPVLRRYDAAATELQRRTIQKRSDCAACSTSA